ncbi:MAG: hypothetical protein AAF564_07045 [Bacteroidota bacterium]
MYNKLSSHLIVVVLFLMLAGCRTYGDYGAEQASFDRVATINTQFAQTLDKAKAELETLQRAAASDSDLNTAVSQYEMLLARHADMVTAHGDLAATLEVKTGMLGKLSTSYRNLNRALGYITAEQLSMHKQYNQFASSLLPSAGMVAMVDAEQGRYQIAPPFYEQIRFALAQKSISEALAVRAGS